MFWIATLQGTCFEHRLQRGQSNDLAQRWHGYKSSAEGYTYNAQTGLLDNQTATRNGTTLLNLSYDYAGANGKRTGRRVFCKSCVRENSQAAIL
jgi:hypothetical protein